MSDIEDVIDDIVEAQVRLADAAKSADRIKYPPKPEPKVEVGQTYQEENGACYVIGPNGMYFSLRTGSVFKHLGVGHAVKQIKSGFWVLVE